MDVLHFGATYLVEVLVEDLVCLEVWMVARRDAFMCTSPWVIL